MKFIDKFRKKKGFLFRSLLVLFLLSIFLSSTFSLSEPVIEGVFVDWENLNPLSNVPSRTISI